MKRALLVTLAILISSCARTPRTPVGISDWGDVHQAASDMALEADPARFLSGLDATGVSDEKLDDLMSFVHNWKKARLRSHYVETLDLTPPEYERYLSDRRRLADSDSILNTPPTWNIPPERILLFRFARKKGNNESAITLTIGAFRRKERWYFCCAK